jgi:hypothetical protein
MKEGFSDYGGQMIQLAAADLIFYICMVFLPSRNSRIGFWGRL